MTTKPLSLESPLASHTTPKPRFLEGFAKRALISRLRQIRHGEVILRDGTTQYAFGRITSQCPWSVLVTVNHPQFYPEVAFGGSIGAGEAYMVGYWQVSDLPGLVRIFLRNREVLDGMDGGFAWLTLPIQKCLHHLNRNTKEGSRRNISAHYDVGNDFFSTFLDETLMYSNAMFIKPDMSLHDAQLAPLKHVCEKFDLKPTDHLLEIGTGWGGFAMYAASHYGCHITTTTISQAQYDLACARIASRGLRDRITVLLSDYRDLTGEYDKLVPLEMIEAVGYQFYDTYFHRCSQLLKPEGMMLLQAITIADQQYERAKRAVDFIQRYIFPGGCILSVTAMTESITPATDMQLFHLEDIGSHYVTTLQAWRENLYKNRQQIHSLGYTDEFFRMWDFYFCYCEGGFAERAVSDIQMLLTKPQARRESSSVNQAA